MIEEKVKRAILVAIPMSICNFRCRYCYLTRNDNFQYGKQMEYRYSPEHVGKAFSIERLGGPCYFNLCANGETLLVKNIDKYVYEIAKQGHFVEIVTNLTITAVLDKILEFDEEILSRITFKCSFHYLQLKERDLLQCFAENVNKIWAKGGSANIEITPDDELIPYIDEVKAFSMEHFGALPHLTIARDDRNERDYLTSLSVEEYDKTWSTFDSSFWKFKKSIFNVKRDEYCYAGKWSLYVNLSTGDASQCYCSAYNQNVFENIDKPIKFVAIGNCRDYHCYNGHALLTLGLIPNLTDVRYGEIRDRVKEDGSHWIQERVRNFFSTQLVESNSISDDKEKKRDAKIINKYQRKIKLRRFVKKLLRR